jgi:hypothetical protein
VLRSWKVGGDVVDECVRIVERVGKEEEEESGDGSRRRGG